MRMPGWIKFYRKALDRIVKPMSEFESWIWLLCKAGYRKKDYGLILTTYGILAKEWGIGKGAARWRVSKWEKEGQVKVQRLTRKQINPKLCRDPELYSTLYSASGTMAVLALTVTNYHRYQAKGEEDSAEYSASSYKNKKEEEKNKKEEEKNKKEEEGLEDIKYLSSNSKDLCTLVPKTPRVQRSGRSKEKKKPDAASTENGKKTSTAHPRYQEVVDYFYRRFRTLYGREYIGQAKDFAAFSRLLKQLDADDLMWRIDEYLKDDEPFVTKNGHNVALLQTRINAYGQKAKKTQGTEDSGYLKPAPMESA